MITILKNSLTNLKGHKLRLIIAFIWIIIGITSIVFVSSVGNAMSAMVKQSFQSIAPRTAIIYFKTIDEINNDYDGVEEPTTSNAQKQTPSQALNQILLDPFLTSDIQILSTLDGVESIKPSSKPVQTRPGFYGENMVFQDISYFDKSYNGQFLPSEGNKYKIIKGREITPSDEGKKVVVLESEAVKEIFGKKDPIGKGVTIGGNNFEIIGISDSNVTYDPIEKKFKKRTNFDTSSPSSYTTNNGFNILSGNFIRDNTINNITVKVKEGYEIKDVSESVVSELTSLHPNIAGEYKIQDQNSIQKSTESLTQGIDKFVRVITIVAMIVGGVGIMNIMYVSVMERNKEIGIRRALGAKPKTILFQFLIESIFITACGGILGLVVGYAVTLYSKNILPFKPIPNINSFLYAFFAIAITGIVFGLVPAFKASKVDPIKIIYK
ncbi:ABC transporter permease [Peptostreptococcus canis]|uniref:FtsX-like permease family protein n=1 Tax=Peptostreptococcus canis TaxID=1159213 RepID=A0ABR6TMZ3_9FIRM|nr:FtsX-like permease family protein [Peptostreptococcus canis]MBP1998901.1 putative ABC transport system permease protein [Peptostreptococcus canis]